MRGEEGGEGEEEGMGGGGGEEERREGGGQGVLQDQVAMNTLATEVTGLLPGTRMRVNQSDRQMF